MHTDSTHWVEQHQQRQYQQGARNNEARCDVRQVAIDVHYDIHLCELFLCEIHAKLATTADSHVWTVWLKLRASLCEAQIVLGTRLVSAKPTPRPCAPTPPPPPPAVRYFSASPRPPVRLVSAKPTLAPNPLRAPH